MIQVQLRFKHLHRPVPSQSRILKPSLPSLLFAADPSPEFLKMEEQFRIRSKQLLERVWYENDKERYTGEDIFRALKKAGLWALVNPFVSANPIKWLQTGISACIGDGYSQWVTVESVARNLPKVYSVRSDAEDQRIISSVETALEKFEEWGMVASSNVRDGFHLFSVWRPTRKGKLALSLLNHERQTAQCKNGDAIQADVESAKALAMGGGSKKPRQTETPTDLKAQFETQIQKIQEKQLQMNQETANLQSRLDGERQKITAMQTQLDQDIEFANSLNEERHAHQRSMLEDKVDMARTELQLKQDLCNALELKLKVSRELTGKYKREAHDAVKKIKTALNNLEITRVKAETLELAGRLREKEEMDALVQTQLAEVQLASAAVQTALEAENPEAFIALLRQVRLLEQNPGESLQAEPPDTLKFNAPALTQEVKENA